MDIRTLDSTVFNHCIPSVFIVCSPFQALCAVAAIKQLEITDYRFVLYISAEDPRNSQLFNYLNECNIAYKAIYNKKWSYRYYQVCSVLRRLNKFKRLFIGDPRNVSLLYVGSNFVSNRASVVYLDDGNATISLLKSDQLYQYQGYNNSAVRIISKYRGLSIVKNYLTIFGDIRNKLFNISSLDLSNANIKMQSHLDGKTGVYIVGTNLPVYSSVLNIPSELFVKRLDDLIVSLKKKYPSEKIIYIPHGRDTSEYAVDICSKYGCLFLKLNKIIELELMAQESSPKVVIGFTSSALYNLKKLFPQTRVINVLYESDLNNENYQKYVTVSEYYKENGIELMKSTLNKV